MFNHTFFSAQYFPPQYHSLLSGTQVLEGRSGYYRLFFHQLQEEALNKSPAKKTQEPAKQVFESVTELPDGSAIVGKPSGETDKCQEQVQTPVVKPMLRVVKPRLQPQVEASHVFEAAKIQGEIQSRLFTSWQIPLIITQAQDVEDEELLLLLAA